MSLPSPKIDLVRFGYLLAAGFEHEGITQRALSARSGIPVTLISRAVNGKEINAGATFALAEIFNIDLAGMLQPESQRFIVACRKLHAEIAREITEQKHRVSPPASRETV